MNVAQLLVNKLVEMGGKIVSEAHKEFGFVSLCTSSYRKDGFKLTTIEFEQPIYLASVSDALEAKRYWTQGFGEQNKLDRIEVYENPELLNKCGEYGDGIVFAVQIPKQSGLTWQRGIHYTLEPSGIREGMFG